MNVHKVAEGLQSVRQRDSSAVRLSLHEGKRCVIQRCSPHKDAMDREMKPYVLRRLVDESAVSRMSLDYAQALNSQQLAAVTAGEGPALVIAGAGSGKTRTLVYRVAYLIDRGIDPASILLVTFTRKAAQEMLSRAGALIGSRSERVTGGTFHSVANTLLRRYGKPISVEPGFTILDRGDSEDLINLLRGNSD